MQVATTQMDSFGSLLTFIIFLPLSFFSPLAAPHRALAAADAHLRMPPPFTRTGCRRALAHPRARAGSRQALARPCHPHAGDRGRLPPHALACTTHALRLPLCAPACIGRFA